MNVISVVLPVYRNAEALAALYARLIRVLEAETARFELIFVDDACPAGSGAVLDELVRQDARVRIIRHDRNQGQRLAVWHGLEAARGGVVIAMDADLQDPPEAIPLLLVELCSTGAGAVFAGRRGAYQGRVRMATSRLYRSVLQALTGIPGDAGLSGHGRPDRKRNRDGVVQGPDLDAFALSARAPGFHRTAGTLDPGGAGYAARGSVGLFGMGAPAPGVQRSVRGVEIEAPGMTRSGCGAGWQPAADC